jgi:hypothetical protein
MAGKMGKAEKLLLKGLKDFQKKGLDFKPKEIELDPELKKLADAMGKKIQKKEMGGEVMDMTKAQPVGMMDGGKVKKMNMGGVIGGRGGNFKGQRS